MGISISGYWGQNSISGFPDINKTTLLLMSILHQFCYLTALFLQILKFKDRQKGEKCKNCGFLENVKVVGKIAVAISR